MVVGLNHAIRRVYHLKASVVGPVLQVIAQLSKPLNPSTLPWVIWSMASDMGQENEDPSFESSLTDGGKDQQRRTLRSSARPKRITDFFRVNEDTNARTNDVNDVSPLRAGPSSVSQVKTERKRLFSDVLQSQPKRLRTDKVPSASKRSASATTSTALERPIKTRRVAKAVKTVATKPDSRKQPDGKPVVWAEGRQALCEALPYYRAYQGASYHSEGLVRGLMLGQDAANRTYIDEEVIICRAAGAMSKADDGSSSQIRDHISEEAGVQSYRNNMIALVPIIVIVAKENMAFPVIPPHQYCVLDHFQVTDIWAEKFQSVVCYFFRLEKINRESKSWWAPRGTPEPMTPAVSTTRATQKTCPCCLLGSKQVHAVGWRCLNEKCSKFFLVDGQNTSTDTQFSKEFLSERTPWPKDVVPPYTLRPELPMVTDNDEPSLAYSRFAWKGIVCPRCGRCNSRRRWDVWKCDTEECLFDFCIKQPVLSYQDLFDGHDCEVIGHAIPLNASESPVKEAQPRFIGNWRINRYDLCPENYVVHLQANWEVNQAPGGSDYLFTELQRDNVMGLQRFPMISHTGRGETLASHFAFNYGMPYKYVVATETKAFNDAPAALMTTMHRLNWAARTAVTGFEAFNEILAVGYFEEGKMGYHDDGERGLGPTVASLSLGGNALMYLRMKERYFKGSTKKKTAYNAHEIVPPGAAFEDERRALNSLVDQLSEEEFNRRLEALRVQHKKELSTWSRPILTMKLAHGDVVIQHGAEMQKYWEHSVVSCGKMRFALTARYIEPSSTPAEHHWKADYVPNVDVDVEGTPNCLLQIAPGSSTPSSH